MMLKDFNFVKSKIVNSNEVFEYTMSDNMIENNYMDLLISPALTNNNALNSPANISQSEQVEAFEQVFDDAIDMLDFEIDNLTKNNGKTEESDDMSASSLMQLLGNKFGPPAGLTIEDFDYSLIQ